MLVNRIDFALSCVQTCLKTILDVRTQLSQQMMDEKFFGIIVSCFDTNTDKVRSLNYLHNVFYD